MVRRIVVAGGRDFTDYELATDFITACIQKINPSDTLLFLSGDCKGADRMGERFATEHDFEIEHHPADWKRYGCGAGPIRNREMAQLCDLLICFWDGQSKGTKSMIEYAKYYNKPIYIKRYKKPH
jgi:hypothetical protein